MAQQAAGPDAPNPFATDPGDELPVGLQLTWRLRALIATGRLASGERLPSFRRLAEWAGVNVNTVRAVYAGLEQEGLVVSLQGQGTFVAEGIEAAPGLEEIAIDALRRARDAGLGPRELAIVASACASMPGALEGPAPVEPGEDLPDLAEESEAIEVRRELRRQIGRLEAELAAYTRDLPGGLPTAPLRAEAHIAGVEELEQTRDTLIAQLSEAQKAAELRAREEARARVRRQGQLAEGEERGTSSGESPLERAMSWWRRKS
ncbi:MAG TPA: GntR family transcriptional regulator [Solirubrobacterales bacterium]|nr:GntR family transcriptional regulator [Solirubrobacterales bacterium]